ncbi:hypothetical protein MIND_00457800 [Mycena indigotica]|uniref:Uncharacterized protein n=1 Tax=Mycena indigotica TaxID=2126181 RepID=A0A8H6W6H1_9AGAR|nr:uncharacterized protein MIND_00457800 [Mycena indigotica]KAF7306662.1 hypothetical protein MIND_00457800 [Mycena indigotica]
MLPPFYVLVRPTTSYLHPTIQYHYLDDSPLPLIPRQGEQVILLDYDPQPIAQSLSPAISVSNVKIDEAQGAALDEGIVRNDRMYTIETIPAQERPIDASNIGERRPASLLLSQFKQRNAVLRRALLNPQ